MSKIVLLILYINSPLEESMPRRAICKKVCCMPKCRRFAALESAGDTEVNLSVEEYEVVRLLDYQGFTQQEAAQKMGIARTTVQALYEQARKSIAKTLVEGGNLVISGGNYYLCNGQETECNCGGCQRHNNNVKGESK